MIACCAGERVHVHRVEVAGVHGTGDGQLRGHPDVHPRQLVPGEDGDRRLPGDLQPERHRVHRLGLQLELTAQPHLGELDVPLVLLVPALHLDTGLEPHGEPLDPLVDGAALDVHLALDDTARYDVHLRQHRLHGGTPAPRLASSRLKAMSRSSPRPRLWCRLLPAGQNAIRARPVPYAPRTASARTAHGAREKPGLRSVAMIAALDRTPLSRSFFDRPVQEVAPELLGRLLVRTTEADFVELRLTEVEAYAGPTDPGSHAYRGRTARNDVMFGPPGHVYVYFTYGMWHCVNLVCGQDGDPGAVLLRAGRWCAAPNWPGRGARRPGTTVNWRRARPALPRPSPSTGRWTAPTPAARPRHRCASSPAARSPPTRSAPAPAREWPEKEASGPGATGWPRTARSAPTGPTHRGAYHELDSPLAEV